MLNHTNHDTYKATYNHYPENMRVDPTKMENVKKMLSLGVSKRKLKLDLMADSESIVSLKTLHNIHTKDRLEKQSAYNGDPLQQLLERLHEIPNMRIRVLTDENNELIGNSIESSAYQC